MKSKLLLATSLTFLFATTAQANMPPKPEKCPSVSGIVAAGLSRDTMERMEDGKWVAGLMNSKFDTDVAEGWSFGVGFITADNADDAFSKATEILPSLQLVDGPTPYEEQGVWFCQYRSDDGYMAGAVTPAFSQKAKYTLKLVK